MSKHHATLFKSISFSYLYILVYLITGILTTPMLLHDFKSENYALLMLVYAIITYLNNIRFGLPESLAAFLAKSNQKSLNKIATRKIFFILVSIILVVLFILFIMASIVNDWRILLGNIHEISKENVKNVFFTLVFFALLRIPLDLSLSIFIGSHDVYLEKIYKSINLLVNLALVLFVTYYSISILHFVFYAGLFDLLVSLMAFIHMALKYNIFHKNPTLQYANPSVVEKNSVYFFQLSITQSIIWGAGIFMVSHMLSLQAVTIYSLTMKIYIYIFYAFVIINSVVAPLYGKYFAKSSWVDIRKVFNFMIIFLPFIGGFIWIGTLYFMSDIIALWTNSEKYYIGDFFVLIMGAFFYFTGYIDSYITLIYSIGKIKDAINIRWKEALLNISVSFIGIYYFGLLGSAIGIAFAITFISNYYFTEYIKKDPIIQINLDFSLQKKHFVFILFPNIIIAFMVTSFVETLLLKIIFFIIMSLSYMLLSWHIVPLQQRSSIIEILNSIRKRKIA